MPFFKDKIPITKKILIYTSYFIQLSFLIAMIVSMYNQRWLLLFVSTLALIFTLIPKIIEKNFKIYLPIEFQFIMSLFIYASIFLGETKDYYFRYWWWDLMLHTFSGFVLGFIGFLFLYTLVYENKLKAKPIIIVFFSFCFALAMGGLWEIFEFSMDTLFGFNMQKSMFADPSGLTDTMFDLIVDAIGALVASFFGFLYLKEKRSRFFEILVKKFVEKNPNLFKK
ncbi:MAG: hypothetical protein ACLFPJ_04870 [Candidatus Woesearchaeota archaeon]